MSTPDLVPVIEADASKILKLQEWLFETIRPYISGRVMELNSGMGSLAPQFVTVRMPLHLSDPAMDKYQSLLQQFTGITAVRAVHNIDFLHPAFTNVYAHLAGRFKTIIAINIADYDLRSIKLVFRNISYLLCDRGRLVTIAPSLTALYDGMELEFNAWKEYNRGPLREFLAGFKLISKTYFDADSNFQAPLIVRKAVETLIIARKIDHLPL